MEVPPSHGSRFKYFIWIAAHDVVDTNLDLAEKLWLSRDYKIDTDFVEFVTPNICITSVLT